MNEEEKKEFEIESEINDEIGKTGKKGPFGLRIASSLYDFVEMIGAITVVIILCFSFVVRLNVVDGPSMENTLHTGEYLVVSDLFYKPTRGDIVVLQSPEAAEQYRKPLVKRVIATEGQTVDIDMSTGNVTVDGIAVTDGHVFVMGDNRNNSADSRLSAIGLIDERCIVGKVLLRVFPFDKFTAFSNPFNGD